MLQSCFSNSLYNYLIFSNKMVPSEISFCIYIYKCIYISVSAVIYYSLILDIDWKRPQWIGPRFVKTCRLIGRRLQNQNKIFDLRMWRQIWTSNWGSKCWTSIWECDVRFGLQFEDQNIGRRFENVTSDLDVDLRMWRHIWTSIWGSKYWTSIWECDVRFWRRFEDRTSIRDRTSIWV